MNSYFRQYLPFWMSCLLFSFLYSSCNETATKSHAHESINDSIAKVESAYTCSMHPQIIKEKPGDCPICGMTLTKKVSSSEIFNDPSEITSTVSTRVVPLTTIQQRNQQVLIEALGNIQNDTRELATISSRVSGRIEKLYVRYRYQMVMPGDKIMELYSPDLVTAQQNLLFLLKNDPSNTSLMEAAKHRLFLIGMSDQQVKQLLKNGEASATVSVYSDVMGHVHEAGREVMEASTQMYQANSSSTQPIGLREGMYVEAGQKIFSLTNPRKAWAVLNLFPENQYIIKKGDAVTIIPETMPRRAFNGHIDFIEPAYRAGSKTLTARVYFDNYDLAIPIGSQVRATIKVSSVGASWLPDQAVVSLGMNDVAFVKTSTGFEARKIQTGIREKNQVQIISGLEAIDSVASNAQYFTDSDSFIKIKN